jgi:hypothetical protein
MPSISAAKLYCSAGLRIPSGSTSAVLKPCNTSHLVTLHLRPKLHNRAGAKRLKLLLQETIDLAVNNHQIVEIHDCTGDD